MLHCLPYRWAGKGLRLPFAASTTMCLVIYSFGCVSFTVRSSEVTFGRRQAQWAHKQAVGALHEARQRAHDVRHDLSRVHCSCNHPAACGQPPPQLCCENYLRSLQPITLTAQLQAQKACIAAQLKGLRVPNLRWTEEAKISVLCTSVSMCVQKTATCASLLRL
jgi:hypothetical protein